MSNLDLKALASLGRIERYDQDHNLIHDDVSLPAGLFQVVLPGLMCEFCDIGLSIGELGHYQLGHRRPAHQGCFDLEMLDALGGE